ncbi:unnamed protein product [Prorocentrum cordatum]|uniref:Uncharacterized protein n=1 Tax=Prorocentrum cordatum TaxID=2364126 RepID=A0ABN9X1T5_9DINO|nr:unnamed protein product [Polarella glacialis]
MQLLQPRYIPTDTKFATTGASLHSRPEEEEEEEGGGGGGGGGRNLGIQRDRANHHVPLGTATGVPPRGGPRDSDVHWPGPPKYSAVPGLGPAVMACGWLVVGITVGAPATTNIMLRGGSWTTPRPMRAAPLADTSAQPDAVGYIQEHGQAGLRTMRMHSQLSKADLLYHRVGCRWNIRLRQPPGLTLRVGTPPLAYAEEGLGLE